MVRPRVARGFNLADAVLHQCIRPLIGACCAPDHHGYQRAFELISGQAWKGPVGSAVFACAGNSDPLSRSHPDAVPPALAHAEARPLLRTGQAMRASLLASAIARTLWCNRFLAASIQDLRPWRSQLCGQINTTQAACTNRTRR